MNWRKKIALSFLPLLAFLGFLLNGRAPESKVTARKVASEPQVSKNKQIPKKVLSSEAIAAIREKQNPDNILRNRIPQSVEVTFAKDETIAVTKGYTFLKDVGAVPRKNFSSTMGEVIQEKDGLVYFRAAEGHEFSPVAISKITNNLHPIASILHIKGASEELRRQVMAEGHEEYYYHAPMQFLSIKSKPSEVLRMYHELKEKGVRVQLEVLKPKHKII